MISSGTTARQGKAPALGPARLLPLPCAFVGKIRGIDMAVKSPSKITGSMETRVSGDPSHQEHAGQTQDSCTSWALPSPKQPGAPSPSSRWD